MKHCSICGCSNKARHRGWCEKHYTRFRRYGDPEYKVREQHRRPPTNYINTPGLCAISGCNSKRKIKRGLCDKHYMRWYKYGDPLYAQYEHRTESMTRSEYATWFWKQTRKDGACIIWQRYIMPNGYGKTTYMGKNAYAHRMAFNLAFGYFPVEIDHVCRNKACVNPLHLEDVTHQENCRRAGPYRPKQYQKRA